MTTIRKFCAVLSLIGLSACAGVQPASRGILAADPGLSLLERTAVATPQVQVLQTQYRVTRVDVLVPRSLKASEANSFRPNADIVWRGEARGDRHAQVAAIFTEAMQTGTAGMQTGPEVIVEVVVTRFHCLTEKTRYTVGGLHSMRFELTVRDAVSGAVVDGPRLVVADVKASGGVAAISEDQAGRTQRVVVVERLAEVIRRELSRPVADALLVAQAQGATGL